MLKKLTATSFFEMESGKAGVIHGMIEPNLAGK